MEILHHGVFDYLLPRSGTNEDEKDERSEESCAEIDTDRSRARELLVPVSRSYLNFVAVYLVAFRKRAELRNSLENKYQTLGMMTRLGEFYTNGVMTSETRCYDSGGKAWRGGGGRTHSVLHALVVGLEL